MTEDGSGFYPIAGAYGNAPELSSSSTNNLSEIFLSKIIAIPAKCPQASPICVEQLHPVDR